MRYHLEDQAGRARLGEKPATRIRQARFRHRCLAAQMDDAPDRLHWSGLAIDAPEVIHLDLQRRVRPSEGELGVDGAAHCRVENRGDYAAMH
jgi:hypothetical protein